MEGVNLIEESYSTVPHRQASSVGTMFTGLIGNQRPAKNFRFIDQSEYSDPPGLPYRVLLVDDDEWTCQLLRDILEIRADISIVGRASDGEEAMTMAILHQPDVVLMDVSMPSLDGIEATYSIKQACPRTVVIGLTEKFKPEMYSAMRTAGAAAFVCKGEFLSIHERILYALRHSMNDLAIHNGGRFRMLQCAYCGGVISGYYSEDVLVSHGTCQNCANYFRCRDQLRRDHARASLFHCLNEAGLNWGPFMKRCLTHASRSLVSLPRQWLLAYGKLFRVPSS
jgi:CheY-like chemotaxis protein